MVAAMIAPPAADVHQKSTPGASPFRVKCGRCGVVFATAECAKLDHFSIYRVVCPHCRWPGRYLASELHAPAAAPKPAKR